MTDDRFYRRSGPLTLGHIAQHVGARLAPPGSADLLLRDVAALDSAEAGDVSVFSDRKFADALAHCHASVVITDDKLSACEHNGALLLVVGDPRLAFAQVGHLFYPPAPLESGVRNGAPIHPSAQIGPGSEICSGVAIGPNVQIGARCRIEANAVIGAGVVIGDDCVIGTNTSIGYALIGSRVVLASNVTVGSPGFSFVPCPTGLLRVPQLGRVVIEDDVEFGANCAIDRGAIGDTVIGRGTMFDNLVHIAHNVRIGKHCLIAGQVGIAGSSTIGDFVMMGGQVGIKDHLTIGQGVRIAAKSGVTRDVAPGEQVGGYPARPLKLWHRQTVALANLAKRNRD